tara:strand:+ start:7616 stop:8170 length:555 start_codon:yes stop_codon:yes gene_type:complete
MMKHAKDFDRTIRQLRSTMALEIAEDAARATMQVTDDCIVLQKLVPKATKFVFAKFTGGTGGDLKWAEEMDAHYWTCCKLMLNDVLWTVQNYRLDPDAFDKYVSEHFEQTISSPGDFRYKIVSPDIWPPVYSRGAVPWPPDKLLGAVIQITRETGAIDDVYVTAMRYVFPRLIRAATSVSAKNV